MSTKIFNGYKLSDKELTLSQINQLLAPARSAMTEAAILSLFRAKVVSACALLDRRVLRLAGYDIPIEKDYDTSDWSTCLSAASLSISEKIEEDRRTGRRNHFDPSASVSLFSDSGGTVALLYSESRSGRDAFERALGCKEYNYWNNADEPDDVDAVEWASRGRRWDRLLGDTGVPAARGASFELVSDSLIWMAEPLPATTLGAATDDADLPQDIVRSMQDRSYVLAVTQPESAFPKEVSDSQGTVSRVRYLDQLRKGEITAFNAVRDRIASILPDSYPLAALREDAAATALRFAHLVPPPPRKASP